MSHVQNGYRDLDPQRPDNNIYLHPYETWNTPVTRVMPDCGHTYFLPGHDAEPPDLAQCRHCHLQREIWRMKLERAALPARQPTGTAFWPNS